MKIGVIGTGYVGLIQAVGLAHLGFEVVAYDIDLSKIEALRRGEPPIYEKGLKELLQQNGERLFFTHSVEDLRDSEIVFVCVGTPQDAKGKANLNFVFSAAERIKPLLTGREIVVLKSTVPVGTNRKVQQLLGNSACVVSNPEFLREGIALNDFFNPERVVLGFGESHPEWVREKMLKVYDYFLKKEVPFVITDWESAELVKYASNTFLAMKISFVNELARLAEKVGADIRDIAKGMGLDSRIGDKFLNAGIGWGGSCFPKDVSALIWQFKEWELEPKLPKASKEINEEQLLWFLNKIKRHYGGNLNGKTFALLGLAFKPYTDDLRESPALKLAEMLIEEGAFVKGYDYVEGARRNVKKLVELKTSTRYSYGLMVCDDLADTLKGADGVIIAVEYREWNREHWDEFARLVRHKAIFDGRNILERKLVEELVNRGWHYEGVGVKV